MNIEYSENFLKDLKKLKKLNVYNTIRDFCFDELPRTDFQNIRNLKKIKGHTHYYRIRIGDYRIGIKFEDENLTVMRALDRKDVYKYFP